MWKILNIKCIADILDLFSRSLIKQQILNIILFITMHSRLWHQVYRKSLLSKPFASYEIIIIKAQHIIGFY